VRGIYIIVEGQTEEEFVKVTLQPYLSSHGIHDVRAILLETSPGHKGGDLKFSRFERNAIHLLKRETDIVVTSLIDFFRLKNDFPKYNKIDSISDKQEKVTFLEQAMAEVINYRNFLPYIQLHEFEGLLFSDQSGFDYIPDIPDRSFEILAGVIKDHKNPELINDGFETAPSKRLEKLIPPYRKTLHGPLIAEEIGIIKILEKCPRFRNWVEQLIEKVKE
tara:strand:- start:544 stop:1203 length:660 start_codon:yes stop_codon:yes gene_type:complete